MQVFISDAQTRQGHGTTLNLEPAGEQRLLPGTSDIHVDRKQPTNPANGRGQGLENAQVYTVASGTYPEWTIHLPLLGTADCQIEWEMSFHLQDILTGSP